MDRHNWYYRFKADVAWLESHVGDIERADQGMVLALTSQRGVGSGFLVQQNGVPDFSVNITAGVGYDPDGKRLFLNNTVNLPFALDDANNPIQVTGVGNERIVSIYAAYTLVDDTLSGVVDGFGNTVFTITKENVYFRLFQGAEAPIGTAVAPADPGFSMVRLADVTIRFGDLTIQTPDINEAVKEYLGLVVAPVSVGQSQINWGFGPNQVSAVDVPIADAGNYFAATEVENALQEINLGTRSPTWRIEKGIANHLVLAKAAFAALRTYTFPEAGNNANVILSEGTKNINGITSFGTNQLYVNPSTGQVGIGTNSPTSVLDVQTGESLLVRSGGIYTALTPPEAAPAGFLGGVGFNFRWNGATSTWRSGTDGANNAWMGWLHSWGSGYLYLYGNGSTGGSNQIVNAAALPSFELARFQTDGQVFLAKGLVAIRATGEVELPDRTNPSGIGGLMSKRSTIFCCGRGGSGGGTLVGNMVYNVGSATRLGVGAYAINYSVALPLPGAPMVVPFNTDTVARVVSSLTTSCEFRIAARNTGALTDSAYEFMVA